MDYTLDKLINLAIEKETEELQDEISSLNKKYKN